MLELVFEAVIAVGGAIGIMLGVAALLAFFVQTIAEFLFAKLEGMVVAVFPGVGVLLGKPKFREGIIALFTVGLGIYAAILYQLDLVFLLAQLFGVLAQATSPIVITWFGLIGTGVMIGMGSSYLHDWLIKPLISKWKKSDEPSRAG